MYDEFRNYKGIARLEPDLEGAGNRGSGSGFSFGEGADRKGEAADPDYPEVTGSSFQQNSNKSPGRVVILFTS